jgi:hypothetical protein
MTAHTPGPWRIKGQEIVAPGSGADLLHAIIRSKDERLAEIEGRAE